MVDIEFGIRILVMSYFSPCFLKVYLATGDLTFKQWHRNEAEAIIKGCKLSNYLIAVQVRVDSPPLLRTPYFFFKRTIKHSLRSSHQEVESQKKKEKKEQRNKRKNKINQEQTFRRLSWLTTPLPTPFLGFGFSCSFEKFGWAVTKTKLRGKIAD